MDGSAPYSGSDPLVFGELGGRIGCAICEL